MINLADIAIAIFAHLLNGSISVVDKFLLTKSFKQAGAYAFWIGILSLGTLVLLPFGFAWPTFSQWLIDLSAGATFVLALFFMYKAIQAEEVSRAATIVGASIPAITLLLAHLFLSENMKINQMIAIIIIILGIILLTYKKTERPMRISIVFCAIFAAFLFALSSILLKKVFIGQPFFSGLALSRLGGVPIAALFLAWPQNRQEIFSLSEHPKSKRLGLFLGSRVAAAFGFILVSLAVALISPTVVNALQGIQYAFIFGLILMLTKFWPGILHEEVDKSTVFMKSLGIAVIILGSVILSLT